MNIIELSEKSSINENVKLSRVYKKFQDILNEIRKKELPEDVIESINKDIEEINSTSLMDKKLRQAVKKKITKILNLLEKELKIVAKDHYRNFWLAIGMSAFGLPIGVAFGLMVMNNIIYLGAGLPIGMVIGIAIGTQMDKKAFEEGRQLDIKIEE